MVLNKITIVFFSPTGGTKKTADFITKGLGSEPEFYDITGYEEGRKPRTFTDEELVVFAVPVYGGRIPEPAADKIRQLGGNDTPAVLVAAYGNRACDDALLELKDLTEANGFIPVAAVMAVAEHSVMRRFGAGRPDQEDARQLEKMGQDIANRLSKAASVSDLPKLPVPGNRPYREYNGIPFKPRAGKSCNGCGLCAARCPVEAIPKEHPDQTDTDKCISCMRCIAVCPSHARELNKIKLAMAEKAMGKSFRGRKENILI